MHLIEFIVNKLTILTKKLNWKGRKGNEEILSIKKIEPWKIKTFDELIESEHGKIGSETRNNYKEKAQLFILSEMLKAARKESILTQELLQEKAGTKKSYISKLETGKKKFRL